MENSRFLACLATDYNRIRTIIPGQLDAQVPSCPEWTVADLTRHVAQVYLHKVACVQDGAERESDWPPPGLQDEEPVALLDRAYAALLAELNTRDPAAPGGTWYGPDPTVGFWFRRMAQETVIHRIDAELATGDPIAPVPDDLAIDGIDELLKVFVAYSVCEWTDYFTEALKDSPGRTCAITTDGATWLVTTAPGKLTVDGGPGATPASETKPDLTITGDPTAVLRWAWNRETPGEPSSVTMDGDPMALEELRRCIVIATQ